MTDIDKRKTWYAIFLFILLLSTILILKAAECRKNIERKLYAERQLALRTLQKDTSFDVLIFTQHWPITVCEKWMEENRKDHQCSLPKQKNSWEIHGIWPTKYHQIGPLFCNDSSPFDMNEILSIEDEMNEKWMNIEKGTAEDSLWSHEWNKHGTCAAISVKELDTQLKYFKGGLNLFDRYAINRLLQPTYIKPGLDAAYKLEEIHTALNLSIGNNFAIVCEKDKNKQQYLFEIRICFDKDLNLHSCDGIVMEEFRGSDYRDEIITNCRKDQEIIYPSRAWLLQKQWLDRVKQEQIESNTFMYHWINIYKFVRLLQWVTL